MNKTVQLVNEWAEFEAAHPDEGIEEFCRYYLTRQRSCREAGPSFGGRGVPPDPASHLGKLMGFLMRSFQVYIQKAFEEIPEIKQKEDFFFLNHISHQVESKKTDIINLQLVGLSTGIDTINRLLANELISERTDPDDKRARLIKVTFKGREVLQRCYEQARKVNQIVFSGMSEDDIHLCIQLLRGVEARQSAMIFDMRDKPIDEVLAYVTGSQTPEQ